MNTVYRIVWNVARQCWAVASEIAKGKTKAGQRRRDRRQATGTDRRHAALLTGAALLGLAAVVVSPQVHAATYTVTSQAELIQAITDANASADASSTINLANSFTITGGGLPSVAKTLTIDAGAFTLTSSSDLNLGVDAGAELTVNGAVTINGNPGFSGGRLIKNGEGTLNVTGGPSSYAWYIQSTAGALVFKDGAQVTTDSTFGPVVSLSPGTNSVTVTGVGTKVTDLGDGTVGAGGTLNIEDGGTYIGSGGSGTLDVGSGAAGDQGTVNVTGKDSLLQASMAVTRGHGYINVLDSGRIASSGAQIGGLAPLLYSGTGTLLVSGAGSRWDNSGAFHLINGSLSVLDGGAVETSTLDLAVITAGTGTPTASILVSGQGSELSTTGTTATAFQLGGGGSGPRSATLTIADGGNVTVGGTGTINLAVSAASTAALNIGGAVGDAATAAGTLDAALVRFGAGKGVVNFNHTDSAYQFDAMIAGNGTVNQTGPGTTMLTANNTYTGGTTISDGTLQLGNGGISGSIVGDIADDGTLVFDRSDATLTLAGVISGTGTVQQIGSGTTTLTGINTYTGATTITAGTLALGGNGAIAQSSGVEDNGTFDISAITSGGTAIKTLSSNGLVQLGGKTLELSAASDTFAGALQGTGGLSLASGNETLTGISTYTGDTYVAGGELRLAAGGQMLGTATTVINGQDAVLTVTGSGTLWSTDKLSMASAANAPVVLNIRDGAHLEVTAGGQVDVGKAASATVNVSGSGSTWDAPGVLLNNNGNGNGVQGVVNVTDGGHVASSGLQIGNPFGGGDLDAIVLVSGAGSTWAVQNGFSIYKGTMSVLDGGRVTAASGTMSGTAAHPANLLVSGTGSSVESTGTFRIGTSSSTATLAEGGRLTAGGVVTLTGTLNIGGAKGEAATGAGALDAATLTFGGSTGILNFNHTDTNYLFGALTSGTGTVNQAGPGTTIFTADNTYTGTTTISGGTLQFGNGGTAGSIVGDVTDNGTLAFDRSNALTYGGKISGSGAIHQFGAGRTDLTGDSSSFTGTTSVTRGALAVNGTLGDASSTMTVSNGAILAGAGTIGGSVAITDGHLAPGNSPGTLTINGNLSLGAASNLDYELGATGVAGGALNDLTKVGGNLILDGTLNVTQSAGGTYGAGIYRLIDYSGTLTDNGLALGSMPAGTDNYVQTSIDHQVNLVNSQGLVLNYWDGDAGPKNNSVVDGGNGTWLAAPGNDNWTEASGAINAPYQDAAFAIFAGKAGTVMVDDSAGAINVSGMQFATDGYLVQGDAINLTAGTNAIRIGDGTTAGADVTATIASELTGPGKLDKVDLGTLVLTGNNTYTGGTTISDGTLQLGDGGTSGSLAGAIIDNGTLTIDRSDAVSLGAITGTGGVDQIGGGTTTLTGNNSYAGATRVVAGTLTAGAAHAFSATSATTVATGATLDLAGFSQDLASLDNSGTVSLSGTAPGTILTVHGDYVGHDGLLRMGTTLSDDASVTDRLIIDGGHASGHTAIQLSNLGGLGALTTGDGIELIGAINGATTTAQTTADAFVLAGGHVDAGAFEYRLYAGDAKNSGENWYLRSTTDTPPPVDGGGDGDGNGNGDGGVVAYRPEVALHASVSGLLRQADLGMLGNLHRRVGDDNTVDGASGDGTRAWARVISQDLQTSHLGTVSPSTDGTLNGVQAGTDLMHREVHDGSYRVGVYGGQLHGSSRAYGFASGVEGSRLGSLDVRSSYAGAYGTYMANAGWYADAVLQQGWHNGRANVLTGRRDDAGGKSTQASLELGKDLTLSAHWLFEPQMQLIVDHLRVDNQQITGATITQRAATTLTSRLGMRFKGNYATTHGQLQPYARFNIWHGSAGTDDMVFAGPAGSTSIHSGRGYSSGEVAAGLTWMINRRFSLYGEASRVYSIDDTIGAQSRSTLSASAGMRVNW